MSDSDEPLYRDATGIEHNLHVIKNADWIIDMGPEGGSKGGTILFEGTPKELLRAKQSLTSAYLRN
jgi:excinuclease UvrABC ATPase subunit